MALSKVERAHRMYREGCYQEALAFYTEALSIAKTHSQRIALHSNRAACFLKLHDFKKAADECTSVLQLDLNHSGALMLHAQTLVTLKEYQSALFDVNRLLELNPSSDVYLNLQARLRTQLSLAPIPEVETELEETDEDTCEKPEEITDKEQKDDNGSVGHIGEESITASDPAEGTEPNVNPPNGSFTLNYDSNSKPHSEGWQAIPKPKGHSRLDYSRWDSVADGSSDDDNDSEDDEEENQPQFRFRVKTVDIRPVK